MRVVEAMLWLLLAHILIRHVALRFWRGSLGRVSSALSMHGDERLVESANLVVRSVLSGARHLPFASVCLPRAMAVQWMLRRRGFSSSLIFGIAQGAQGGGLHDLHAWVEAGGKTVIGDNPERIYQRGLVLVQP